MSVYSHGKNPESAFNLRGLTDFVLQPADSFVLGPRNSRQMREHRYSTPRYGLYQLRPRFLDRRPAHPSPLEITHYDLAKGRPHRYLRVRRLVCCLSPTCNAQLTKVSPQRLHHQHNPPLCALPPHHLRRDMELRQRRHLVRRRALHGRYRSMLALLTTPHRRPRPRHASRPDDARKIHAEHLLHQLQPHGVVASRSTGR